MDHLSPHKNEATLALIAAAGASVHFLPAYSPNLNPIEKMWSKVKQCLRSAEARTAPHRRAPARKLLEAIAAALQTVTPQEARTWFASCGYNFI